MCSDLCRDDTLHIVGFAGSLVCISSRSGRKKVKGKLQHRMPENIISCLLSLWIPTGPPWWRSSIAAASAYAPDCPRVSTPQTSASSRYLKPQRVTHLGCPMLLPDMCPCLTLRPLFPGWAYGGGHCAVMLVECHCAACLAQLSRACSARWAHTAPDDSRGQA